MINIRLNAKRFSNLDDLAQRSHSTAQFLVDCDAVNSCELLGVPWVNKLHITSILHY